MSDILSKNPQLEDVLRKAVERVGTQNHAKTQDNQGAVISNEGKIMNYADSKGQHPHRIDQKSEKAGFKSGWHKVLGEQENKNDKTAIDLDVERQKEIDKIKKGVNGHPKSAVKRMIDAVNMKYKKLIDAAKQKENSDNKEEEVEEATGSGSSGAFVAPMQWNESEVESIMKKVVKEEVAKNVIKNKVEKIVDEELGETDLSYSKRHIEGEKDPYNFSSQGPFPNVGEGSGYNYESGGPLQFNENVKEKLKNRLVNKLKEQYTEKPLKTQTGFKDVSGFKSNTAVKTFDTAHKEAGKEGADFVKSVNKKMKDYLDIENNSHPEFPHQNNSKTDYKSPMYRNTPEEEDFIDDFRGMGLQDADGVESLDRISDYLGGAMETGNAQVDKDGKALGNVVPNKLGDRLQKTMKRKKAAIAKQKSSMTNLRGYTPDVQKVTQVKEDVKKDVDNMKKLWSYTEKTQ
tara:strand:+ start:597 stop:1973 length:1377 start_codon:yes stop_codon:yes gene_type:complete